MAQPVQRVRKSLPLRHLFVTGAPQTASHETGTWSGTQLQSERVERIADHVTDLHEMVVLMVRGEDVRPGVKPGGVMRAIPDHEGN